MRVGVVLDFYLLSFISLSLFFLPLSGGKILAKAVFSVILFTRLFLYKMPGSEKKKSNATENLRNRFKI